MIKFTRLYCLHAIPQLGQTNTVNQPHTIEFIPEMHGFMINGTIFIPSTNVFSSTVEVIEDEPAKKPKAKVKADEPRTT